MALPKRKVHLIVEEMGEETLVYCTLVKKAFCLNPVCAKVFALCDGTHSPAEIASELALEENTVINSLAVLGEHVLLEPLEAVKRRQILKGGAVLIPAVLAVSAPEPSTAASVPGGCITNIQCGAKPGFVNSCQPCDFDNGAVPDCAPWPNSYCMSAWRVREDAAGNPFPLDTCVNDSQATGFVNQCDFVNPSNIWALDCNAARAAVIAAGKPFAVYRCCNCPGR
ncbi:MAG: hypothetical protein KF760_26745 [Candidatus Eremiobacteraeota bacterium]|nr:hypothetical protein [Candidatus Eremiobacteraeota bacterium]